MWNIAQCSIQGILNPFTLSCTSPASTLSQVTHLLTGASDPFIQKTEAGTAGPRWFPEEGSPPFLGPRASALLSEQVWKGGCVGREMRLPFWLCPLTFLSSWASRSPQASVLPAVKWVWLS